jgi:uncharacterized repeat protein (TIGR03803 family)
MNGKRQFRSLLLHIIARTATAALGIAVFALTVALAPSAQAQTPATGVGWTETLLYSFCKAGQPNCADGADPLAVLIFDAAGNLYGTTQGGGAYAAGTVFELTPTVGGGWTEQVLHSFGEGTDGANPYAGLIVDAAGNLYGTTQAGGNYTAYCPENGCGTVFELTPSGGGNWAETVLYSFCSQANCADGMTPQAGLIFDAVGDLYGTTYQGGTFASHCNSGCGTVFELTPTAGGGWTGAVLYSFGGLPDGSNPTAGLIFDAAGNLYGTANYGGVVGEGTVFELTPSGGGNWAETVLYSFCSQSDCVDGSVPAAGLIFDAAGNLYGTAIGGGNYQGGTAFELTPTAGGGWTEEVLHSFGNGTDGFWPHAGLIFDARGNLYGTTRGAFYYECTGINHFPNCGTVFELTPTAGGNWTETLLHRFNNNGTDGFWPYAGLIFGTTGNLYGTTLSGGTYGFGTVFELTPSHPCVFCSHTVSSDEGDVLPAEGRDVLERGGIEQP